MCSKDRTLEENVEGAEALAYLIETDADLQRIAAISDHIIRTLGDYLKYTDIQQISRNGRKSVSTRCFSEHERLAGNQHHCKSYAILIIVLPVTCNDKRNP